MFVSVFVPVSVRPELLVINVLYVIAVTLLSNRPTCKTIHVLLHGDK